MVGRTDAGTVHAIVARDRLEDAVPMQQDEGATWAGLRRPASRGCCWPADAPALQPINRRAPSNLTRERRRVMSAATRAMVAAVVVRMRAVATVGAAMKDVRRGGQWRTNVHQRHRRVVHRPAVGGSAAARSSSGSSSSSSKSEVQISSPARRFRLLAAKPKTLHARRGR